MSDEPRSYLERAATHADLAERLLAGTTEDYGNGPFVYGDAPVPRASVAHAHAAVGSLLLALHERTHR